MAFAIVVFVYAFSKSHSHIISFKARQVAFATAFATYAVALVVTDGAFAKLQPHLFVISFARIRDWIERRNEFKSKWVAQKNEQQTKVKREQAHTLFCFVRAFAIVFDYIRDYIYDSERKASGYTRAIGAEL